MGLFGKNKKGKNELPVEDAFSDELMDMQMADDTPRAEDIYQSTELPAVSAYDGTGAGYMDDNGYGEMQAAPAPAPSEVLSGDDLELFCEQFTELTPIDGERNDDICNKFVMSGISGFGHGFDSEMLDELNYDEFCHVYNTIEWYVNNIAPDTVYAALKYKRYLRTRLLERFGGMTTYTIITTVTSLPYAMSDGSMLLFTEKELAERVVESKKSAFLEVCEITPDSFDVKFCEYYCAGFETVKINVKNTVAVGDIYRLWVEESYGNICKAACAKMVAYKQSLAVMEERAAADGRTPDAEEKKRLIKQSLYVMAALFDCKLMLPVNPSDGSAVIPAVSYGGGKYVALFTDSYAMCAHFKRSVQSTALPGLIGERYRDIADNDDIKGIIVNPGREEFVMTKKMLARIFEE